MKCYKQQINKQVYNKTNNSTLHQMKKQSKLVQYQSFPKHKYSLHSKMHSNLNLSTSLDKKIGATRVSEQSIFAYKDYNKAKLSASLTFDQKQKRGSLSHSKIYDLKKLGNVIKLPTIKRGSVLLSNPQQSTVKTKRMNCQKQPYYQCLISKSNSHKQVGYLSSLAKQHFLQTIQALKTGKHLKVANPPQLKLHKKNPKLKTVYLDLDQTLIHCDQGSNNYTVMLDFPVQGGMVKAGIRVRPYCKDFLQELVTFAQVIVFTASSQDYANVVLNYLDPHKKIFAHRLYRQHCTLQKGYYLKDLRTINRRLEDVVLVDNSGFCFMLQPFNGIPIVPYYHYGKDKQLMNLLQFLKQVLKADDVRVPIRNAFFWHKYFENDNDPGTIFQANYVPR